MKNFSIKIRRVAGVCTEKEQGEAQKEVQARRRSLRKIGQICHILPQERKKVNRSRELPVNDVNVAYYDKNVVKYGYNPF